MAALPGGAPETPDIAIEQIDLAARIDEALAVQALAFGLGADEVEVRRHIVHRHLLQPGACALGALTGAGRLVGFVYGMPNDRTHWWSTVVEPYLRRAGTDGWLDDSFVITELHVHPVVPGPRPRPLADHHDHRRGAAAPLDPLRHRHREPGPRPVPLARLPGPRPPGAVPQRTQAVRRDGAPPAAAAAEN